METKGERERYIQLGCRVTGIARRDKTFLNEQYKEREENNRMGKVSDLFKKSRDIKGNFHGKMSTIKNRNGKVLTEAKEI